MKQLTRNYCKQDTFWKPAFVETEVLIIIYLHYELENYISGI